MSPTPEQSLRDAARTQLSAIDDQLDQLTAWWRDPGRRRDDNTALLAQLGELEAERGRLQAMFMDGQPASTSELATLAERVDRLRRDFSTLTS